MVKYLKGVKAMVDLIGSYSKIQQNAFASENKVKTFEDYFTGKIQSYATTVGSGLSQDLQNIGQQASGVKKQAAYDITGAYSNFLQQQRTIQGSQNITEGYKQQLASGSQKAYAGQ